MNCFFDKNGAVATCRRCGRAVCDSCKRIFLSDTLCKVCTAKMYAQMCSIVRYEPDENGN